MRRACVRVLALTLSIALGWPMLAQGQAKKPNILVVWGDDIGGFNISGTARSVIDLQSLGPNSFVLLRDTGAADELRAFGSSAANSSTQ